MSKNLTTTKAMKNSIEQILADDSVGLKKLMPAFPLDNYFEILKEELFSDKVESKHNMERYLTLSKKIRAPNQNDQIEPTDKSKLSAFLLFLIYRNLRKKSTPHAYYYCDLSYKLDSSLDYSQLQAYEVARYLEREEKYFPELKQKINYLYFTLSKSSFDKKTLIQQVVEMAKIKMIVRKASKADIAIQLLDISKVGFMKVPLCNELAKFIDTEKSWLILCKVASQFKADDDPEFTKLLDFLKQTSLSIYPSLTNYNIANSELKPISMPEKEKIWKIMRVVRTNRELLDKKVDENFALGWEANSISDSRINRACFIWHDPADNEEDALKLKSFYLNLAIQEDDPDVLYELSQGSGEYKNYLFCASELYELQQYIMDEDAEYDKNLRSFQVQLLNLAATNGSVEAQYELSVHYAEQLELYPEEEDELNLPISKDELRARHDYFLILSASHGHAKAQYQYAQKLEDDFADAKLYYSYYFKAAKQGLETASKKLEEAKSYARLLDPRTISEEEIKFLELISQVDEVSHLNLATCYNVESEFTKKLTPEERNKKMLGIYGYLITTTKDPQIKLKLFYILDDMEILKKMLFQSSLDKDLDAIFKALQNKKGELISHEKYSLSCSIIDLLPEMTKPQKKKLKEEKIITLAQEVIHQSAIAGSNDARIRYAISIQDSGKSQQMLKLFLEALTKAEPDEIIVEDKKKTLERIGKLLSKTDILTKPLIDVKSIINLSYLELDNKSKCNLAKRISEVLEQDSQLIKQESSKLRMREVNLLLSVPSTDKSTYKIAQEVLILGFCDGKYELPTTIIAKFQDKTTTAMKLKIVARLCEPLGSLKDDKEFCDSEIFKYCKNPEVKAEVRRLRPDFILPEEEERRKKLQEEKESRKKLQEEKESRKKLQEEKESRKKLQEEKERRRKLQEEKERRRKLQEEKERRRKLQEEKERRRKLQEEKERRKRLVDAENKVAELRAATLTSDSPPASPLLLTQPSAKQTESPPKSLTDEMSDFLKKEKKLRFFVDLPSFLRDQFEQLFKKYKGCEIILKGSKFYRSKSTSRVPSDLDIEILIPEMSAWREDKIKEFIKDICGSNEGVSIYNRPPHFTVNFKDEKRDYVFYDSNKAPNNKLSWTSNREERVICDPGSLSLSYDTPRGFAEYVKSLKEKDPSFKYDSKKAFIINPNARGLLLRLSFLEAIGVATGEEIDIAVKELNMNPVSLLMLEFKLDKIPREQYEDKIRSKIDDILKSHFADNDPNGKFKKSFIQTLDRVANLPNPNATEIFISDEIQEIVREKIKIIKNEIIKKPDVVALRATSEALEQKTNEVVTLS